MFGNILDLVASIYTVTLCRLHRIFGGLDFEAFLSSITDTELYTMMDWLQCSCAFGIDCEYFGNIEESSGYDIAKETVIREYIQRLLMDYIENNLSVNKDNVAFVDHLYSLVRTISFRSI